MNDLLKIKVVLKKVTEFNNPDAEASTNVLLGNRIGGQFIIMHQIMA